jgi:hypothetical protein
MYQLGKATVSFLINQHRQLGRYLFSQQNGSYSKRKSQGQLLEMQLLESRLLDIFFKNVICSTQKASTA